MRHLSLNSTNITDSYIGSGQAGGEWWGWEAEGGHGHRDKAVVSSVKHPQCTCQAKTVDDTSLTPHAPQWHPVVDTHEFTESEKCCL